MFRNLTVLALMVTAPLAAQVTPTPPVSRTPLAAPVPVKTPDPLSGWRVQSDLLQQSIDRAWSYADLASTYQNYSYNHNFDAFDHLTPAYAPDVFVSTFSGPRAPWAKNDPADSLYRSARDLLNRGDYRRSATLFKELPQKFPASAYVNDAMYWQAFALYRIGGTPELQEALTVLEALKARAPEGGTANKSSVRASSGVSTSVSTNISTVISGNVVDRLPVDRMSEAFTYTPWRSGNDATALAARIATVLSQRGLSNDAAVKRALAAGANTCDVEDQQVRSEALSALMQSDPEMARQSATKILARRDECSVPLRRTAVALIGNKRDEAAAAALIPVAKADPSIQVRGTAIDYLGRLPGDAALNALQELAATADDESIQRAAGRAIASSDNPRARAALRGLVEKKDAPLALRVTAVDAFGRNSTAEDGAWLRAVYGRTTEPRVKSAIVRAVGRVGGDANDQWLSALVGNEDEPMEARMAALDQAGRTMDIAALGKLYDGATQRQVRQTVVDLLASRKEPAAVDKLIDIAKNGTDPGMRRAAISALARSKDPRAQKLLLDLVDHE